MNPRIIIPFNISSLYNASWQWARGPGFNPRQQRGGDFPHLFVSRMTLGSSQPPKKEYQCVPGGKDGQEYG